ncbi:M20 metallopeptidase family protein [Pleomorphochaeta sp. DL1XJH-081]|jgi:amidohydrolase|uniref:M20 metallopeptidase family protein n=1 Tax=Pleomorphochaeta sp. DL1XJH-081 TaxID=3409690 RepID=UPI003BB6F2BD
MKVQEAVRSHNKELIALRRDFHAHPELGFQEFGTSKKITEYLKGLGLDPQTVTKTGVTALLKGKTDNGPVLLMRADMDALPVEEQTGLPFTSEEKGLMHACGHDAHMAMMLTAAKILVSMKDSFDGTIKFVFQPNEEIAGAQSMIDDGILENPKVDAAMGVHIWSPLPSGTLGVKSGAVTSSMDVFKVVIKGRGGHTGYPDSAVDPVVCASAVVQQVQSIQTRFISPMKPIALMFGRISGGTKNNIIPDSVELEGTIRYLFATKPGNSDNPTDKFKKMVTDICNSYGCTCEFYFDHENDAVINDPTMTALAYDVAKDIVGEANVAEHASMACEDFAAFGEHVPAVFTFIGTASEQAKSTYPHHNPRFTIDEETLPIGVEFLVESALRFFKGKK